MKRSRFSEEQIIGILKEHEAGVSVADLCRKHGVSDAQLQLQTDRLRAVVLLVVPELTRSADIKLNTQVSLRPLVTGLAWLQVAQIGQSRSLVRVLRDKGSLRALGAAPPGSLSAAG